MCYTVFFEGKYKSSVKEYRNEFSVKISGTCRARACFVPQSCLEKHIKFSKARNRTCPLTNLRHDPRIARIFNIFSLRGDGARIVRKSPLRKIAFPALDIAAAESEIGIYDAVLRQLNFFLRAVRCTYALRPKTFICDTLRARARVLGAQCAMR